MGEYSGVAAPVSTQYPQYIRDNYTVWGTTMMWALESNEIWEAVDPGGDEFKKGASKYRKDRQALTAICSVMPMDVKQHLISKKSAKEAWETIKTLNLGHERVREAALQTLQKKYENLEMGEDETLDAFASRVATLVNGIRALDEKLEEISIVRRFLRAAPPRYLSVVSAIEQCVDLKTLTMDDLVGRFKAHDERMKITYGDAVPEEHVMLTRAQWQVVVAKEKGDKAYDNRSDKEASRPTKKYIAWEDEDDAPPRRKFDIKKVRCHNCGELGHFKVDCRKPPKPKERALIAQEGDDGPMMLMLEVCEQKDEEELPPPSPATEIVTDHGLPCVDHVDKLCDEGVVEKQRSAPYPRETTDQASEALELVHGAICGPISPATPSGNEYFMLVVDDLSQYMWIVLLKSKDQGLQAFEKIKEAGEVKARAKKSLRIDRGGELKHTVVAMARSMMESKGLPGKFWGEAVNTAVYLLNRAPTRSMVGGTPYEAWYGRKLSVDHLRTFGCVAHVKTVSGHKRSLAGRSTPMIMTGYEEGSKAYRLCNPSTNKVVVTCDVVFEEDLSWIWDSTEPDEMFTVVCSELHVDDQGTRFGGDTDTRKMSSDADGDSSPRRSAASGSKERGRGSNPGRSTEATSSSDAHGGSSASSAAAASESARSGSPHGSTPSSSGGAQSRPVGRDVAAASSSSGAAPPHEAGPRRGLSAGRDPSGASSEDQSPREIDPGTMEGTPTASTSENAEVSADAEVGAPPGVPGSEEGLSSPETRPDGGSRVAVLTRPEERRSLSQMDHVVDAQPFLQTEFYQLGNGGEIIFERDLFSLSEFLGRPPPEVFGGMLNDQPGGQLQWVIMVDLRGRFTLPMSARIQFSFRENNWADGLARGLQEGLARLCGQNFMDFTDSRFVHYARHNSLGVPMNLPSHPQLRHHVDHLDFMLSETRIDLDNSREYANHTHIQLAQQAETIKVIAGERRALRRANQKKDHAINRLKARIATLKATIAAQAEQIQELEGEGEGENIQGDGYSYVSNDDDYEEEEDDDLEFHPYEDGHEHLDAGVDNVYPINVDGE
ncbi:hypothetical protein QYE76_008442 [Lolium multiflorum]|uniref:CCHC-type domain-containing protein n=1 Tax=Lolium multiflorum TaxID=4521 RepID=A0AAD8X0W2_LOLMU|nr:hypothetical protein QYE76_008442 [Lolium multiflorum]